jgi:imidazoleglycerol-phosphate dehydratase
LTSPSQATGDVDVDAHHTVEDVAIVLGDALREALGDKRGIARFGDATVPLDEALVQAVVDVAGRPYCVQVGEPQGQEYVIIGGSYVGSLTRHVFETLAHHAGIALHVRVLPAATLTTSSRPSSRRWLARCGPRSPPTRG